MKQPMTKMMIITSLVLFPAVSMAESGVAVEGFVGKADQTNTIDGFEAISGYESSKGVRGIFGINRALDFEIGYTDFGKAEDSGLDEFGDLITDTMDTHATQVGIKARLPLGHKVALVGRAGVALWQVDYRQTDSAFPGEAFTDSDEGVDGYYGVGIQLELDNNFRIGAQYDALSFSPSLGDASTDHEIDNFGVFLGFAF